MGATSKRQILLAEDDEVNQAIVRAFLADADDLELTIAPDGRLALEAVLSRKFDLMIIDQNMPFINGDRIIRHLRAARSSNATTPVIRFTADADQGVHPIRMIDGVAETVLPKPLRKDALVSTVRAMLAAGRTAANGIGA